jgi:hypothetical protein
VPKIATTTWVVKDRTGVFVDYGQNAFDRTIASAYSIRPMADARASAPLRWDEVPDVRPEAFTLETMRDRVAKVGDLTADIWQHRADLKPLFKTLKLKDPVVDDRVLVRPSRPWTEEEQRAWRERGRGRSRRSARTLVRPRRATDRSLHTHHTPDRITGRGAHCGRSRNVSRHKKESRQTSPFRRGWPRTCCGSTA